MRLADTVFRGGHLSERALIDACTTGERPEHLDRCDRCAGRAVELGRWLDEVRAVGLEEADAAFPPERLAVQHAQILRRLEQADRPARVITFPGPSREERLAHGGHGIRPAWVGIAAAAGLVLGLIGGQVSARLTMPPRAAMPPAQVLQPATPASTSASSAASSAYAPLDLDQYDRPQIEAVAALDEFTPLTLPVSQHVVRMVGPNR